MSIFSRMINVVRSNVNDLINKAEDPKKMLEQIVIDLNSHMQSARKEVAQAIADEKGLQRNYMENKNFSESWERKAQLAVERGNDDLAIKALKQQEIYQTQADEYKKQWDIQKISVDKLKNSLTELNKKIEEAARKKNLLIARQKRAEAQKKIATTMSKLSDTAAFDSFARMESKIQAIENQAEASMEIENSLKNNDLEAQFEHLGEPSLQEKLTAMKNKIKTQ